MEEILRPRPDQPRDSPNLLHGGYRDSFLREQRPQGAANRQPPPSAEVIDGHPLPSLNLQNQNNCGRKISDTCRMKPYNLVRGYQHMAGTRCLHPQNNRHRQLVPPKIRYPHIKFQSFIAKKIARTSVRTSYRL
jgi:hypothetical protein